MLTKHRQPSFNFDAYGGSIESEDLLYNMNDNEKNSSIKNCIAHSSDPEEHNEKQYFIVNDILFNINDIRGPCGNLECPIAVMAKQKLNQLASSKSKCTCKGTDQKDDKEDFFKQIFAVNPYRSLSDLSLSRECAQYKRYNLRNDCPPFEGNKKQISKPKTSESNGTNGRCSETYKNPVCSNCFKKIDCVPKEMPCPLCEICNTRCPSEKRYEPAYPLIRSMSDEFQANRLSPKMCCNRKQRGCPCCTNNRKKCSDCVSNHYRNNGRPSSYASVSDTDAGSGSINSRNRFSMYCSSNKMRLPRKKSKQDSSESNRFSREQRSDIYNDPCRSKPKNDVVSKSKNKKFQPCIEDESTIEEQLALVHEKLRAKKKSRLRPLKKMNVKSRYSYCFGKKYPGIKIGHRECNAGRGLVPKNMGWLWNVPVVGINRPRIGWKPGAVTKPIKELMMHFLTNYPCDTLPNFKSVPKSIYTDFDTPNLNTCERPTLQVKKQNGELQIRMNPLKNSQCLRPGETPYLECPPMRFRISKDVEAQKLDKCKEKLREMGFTECGCKDPCSCNCRTPKELDLLKNEMKRLSQQHGLKKEMHPQDFSLDTNDKDFDIEFTTPSALVGKKPKIMKKDTKAQETQYNDKDFILPSQNGDNDGKQGKATSPGKGLKGKEKKKKRVRCGKPSGDNVIIMKEPCVCPCSNPPTCPIQHQGHCTPCSQAYYQPCAYNENDYALNLDCNHFEQCQPAMQTVAFSSYPQSGYCEFWC